MSTETRSLTNANIQELESQEFLVPITTTSLVFNFNVVHEEAERVS